jgi:HAD superfamily hydrolase (TIGR01509 family)
MVRALLLDVMGTLVTEPFFEVVPRALGLTLEQILADKHPTAWVDFELGLIDEAELVRRFFLDGRKYPHAEMKAAMIEAYDWIDGVEPLLAELRAAGNELHLLSNYPLWYRHIEEKLALSRYAPWTFVSCHTGVRKPDPEAYLGAARALGAEPSQLLFVDDRGVNCKAARAVGMDAIRFENATQFRAELQGRSLLRG